METYEHKLNIDFSLLQTMLLKNGYSDEPEETEEPIFTLAEIESIERGLKWN